MIVNKSQEHNQFFQYEMLYYCISQKAKQKKHQQEHEHGNLVIATVPKLAKVKTKSL